MEKLAELQSNLQSSSKSERLNALKTLAGMISEGTLSKPSTGNDVNNHIHTTFSFSPYSPSEAVWRAYQAGLSTAGIMDHDAIGGAAEFIEAGQIMGLATTIGVECRTDLTGTRLEGRRINNPDQNGIAYVALHGIPHTQIEKIRAFFKPYTVKRNERNLKMIEQMNAVLEKWQLSLDFETDVVPLSMLHEGGSITERHLLYALSLVILQNYLKGPSLMEFLKNELKLTISAKLEGYLLDTSNPHYTYDLLGLLKSEFLPSIYVSATDECPKIKDVVALSRETGAILAYAYLGDIGDSVTGDKKTQTFEDSYLDLLFEEIGALGFNAVTYMPSRNTIGQLERVMTLCERNGFFQISGEDINSSRQSFICEAQRNPRFNHLVDAAWALIGHEKAATRDLKLGMFSEETLRTYPGLSDRIEAFKMIGLNE